MKFIILLVAIVLQVSADPLPIKNAASANGRMAGGSAVADSSSIPFMAAVFHNGLGFLCGGVTVHENWILTTAECVYAYSFEQPPQVYVDLGGTDLTISQPTKLTYQLAKIIIHPEFQSREMIYYSNLALMETIFKITPTTHIAPIALPLAGTAIAPGTAASTAGWGGTNNNSPTSMLELSNVNAVVSKSKCAALSGMVIDRELCTDPLISSSACKYDHGNPLFEVSATFGNILIGLVNYAPCLAVGFNYPTIYTSIPDYVNWIQTTI